VNVAGHRVREDKEALRFWRDLQHAMRGRVPEGKSLVLTMQAPIRQANKTVAALNEKLEHLLADGKRSARWEILTNRIRVRVVDEELQPRVTGYVFTDEVDPAALLSK